MLFWAFVVIASIFIGCCLYLYLFGNANYSYLSSRKRLSARNKAVLITGCDSGFGHMLALRLPVFGYKVFAGCLFPEGEGAEKLKCSSPDIVVLQLDVTNEDDIKNIRQTIAKEKGDTELWAVVNNAGIMQMGEFEWSKMDVIRKVFEVNTFGMMGVTKEVLPLIKKSKGRVVNVTSINGERTIPGSFGYSMSKAAAKMFSDIIRLELRKWDVKVISIAPYSYRTPLGNSGNAERLLRECWETTDPDIKATLGDEYLEELITSIKASFELLHNPNCGEVVDCMIDAITLELPKLRYRPGNLINRILFGIPLFLPEIWVDAIQYNFMPEIKRQE